MATRQTTIRFAERTDEQLAKLADLFGDRTKAITVAIDRLYQTEITERGETMDRTGQVDWIRNLADNIAANLGEGTAGELVGYALSDEGRESWGIELPDWFDSHDRNLLIRFVAELL